MSQKIFANRQFMTVLYEELYRKDRDSYRRAMLLYNLGLRGSELQGLDKKNAAWTQATNPPHLHPQPTHTLDTAIPE